MRSKALSASWKWPRRILRCVGGVPLRVENESASEEAAPPRITLRRRRGWDEPVTQSARRAPNVLRAHTRYGRIETRRGGEEPEFGRNPLAMSSTAAKQETCPTTVTALRPRAASLGSDRPVSQFRTVSVFTPMALARSACRQPRSRRYCRSRSAKVWQGCRGMARVSSIGRASSVCLEIWTARAGSPRGSQPKKTG